MINLYIVDYHSDFKLNGLNTYVTMLGRTLEKKRGVKICYIWARANVKKIEHKKVNNVKHIYFPNDLGHVGNFNNDSQQYISYLVNEVKNKKNIIFHLNWIPHTSFALLLKQNISCTTILTKHCIPWRDLITSGYHVFRTLDKKLNKSKNISAIHPILVREQLAYNFVDHIICVTNFAQRALTKLLPVPLEKTTVIYNGLTHTNPSRQSKETLKQKYGFENDEKIILFAGAINKRKGIIDLIKVFNKLTSQSQNIRLVIAGDGDYSSIFKHANKNWSKITTTGGLPKQMLYEFYQMADIGVVPSYVEQCSYTAIEMMHYRLPLIVADVDGLKEIVPDECGLKVKLKLGKEDAYIDSADLLRKIRFFLGNEATASQYALRARNYASKYLSANKMTAETLKVYQELVTKSNCRVDEPHPIQDSPLVSIIMPCYNAEVYLKNCLNSILAQTYSSFELIIVDDGSSDNTISIVQQYSDKRIVLISMDENKGITNALNVGIKGAKGKYIARMDADDVMHKDRLHKQVAFLEDRENKDISVVGCNHYIITETGELIGLKQYPLKDEEIKVAAIFQNPFSHPSVMARAEVLKNNKYTNTAKYAEDYSLWFKIFRKYQVANLPEFLTYYRVHNSNTAQKNGKAQKENTIELLSGELDKLGLQYTSKELAVHIAISLNFGNKYFNTIEKREELKNWINRILKRVQRKNGYSSVFIKGMRTYVLEMYCGIYE